MGDGMNPPEQAHEYRWRPAVAPFRPRSVRRRRPRRPLPGQMLLPGIEPDAKSGQPDETSGTASHALSPAEARPGGSHPETPEPAITCPNCGGAEFDEDGDCVKCWEPGVGRVEIRREVKDR